LLEAFQSAQIMILEKEFKEMLSEIDQGQGKVNYEELLSALYLTQMFVNELKLTSTLRERDTQNRGGLTIAQMK
jgi:Ca2+-binding EF-hand superfamily protein